jgi:hypothetical protein
MRSYLLCLLLLGVFEIFYGVLLGRALILGQETELYRTLQPTSEQARTIGHQFSDIKDQLLVVAGCGVITVVITGALWRFAR